MSDGTSLTIKRPITVRAVVTPTWKEEAERELSNGIALHRPSHVWQAGRCIRGL